MVILGLSKFVEQPMLEQQISLSIIYMTDYSSQEKTHTALLRSHLYTAKISVHCDNQF